jgi:hypothetical protein
MIGVELIFYLIFQIYIIVNILLFSLPHFSDNYMRSGAYFYILPKALPFAQVSRLLRVTPAYYEN